MSDSHPADRPGLLHATCRGAAVLGGVVLLATSLLTTASVGMRWLTNDPIRGDFELIQIGSGIAVLAMLAYGTSQRGNLIVDTFTTWLPRRVQDGLDGFWNLVWAAMALAIAERMVLGANDTLSSNTQTMVLGLPTWWAVGIGALAFALTGFAAFWWGRRLFHPRASRRHG